MAKGLRIHHPTERSVVLLVPIPAKSPTGVPKDVHIHLDENGDSIVSEGVWEELMLSNESRLSNHEFVILNEVLDPPTIVMGPDVKPVTRRAMRETPGGIYDAKLQAVAQQFAPKGIGVQITTHKRERQ